MTKLKLGAEVAALNPGVDGSARLPGRGKYGAKKAERGGVVFDSELEARRYDQLVLLERAGEISRLLLQKCYTLKVNGVEIGRYYADFTYWQDGQEVVEDVKGFRTRAYLMKKKLMLACHGIAIREVDKDEIGA